MKKLEQKLFITFSNQRKRELINSELTQTFDKVITLENFISEVFLRENIKTEIDSTIGSGIVHKIIKDNSLEYFDYLDSGSNSLGLIWDFIIKCSRNRVPINKLLSGEKLSCIEKIVFEYSKFKLENNLFDIADMEEFFLENYSNDWLSNYSSVSIDCFSIDEIKLTKSLKQMEIVDLLSKKYTILADDHSNKTYAKIFYPKSSVFDSYDEVKTALKIGRKLMESGVADNDILFVVTDIKKYNPIFKLYLEEYGMKAYSSLGTPVSSYLYNSNDTVRSTRAIANRKIEELKALYSRLEIAFNQNIEKSVLDSTYIPDDKIGIEITEANQFIGINKNYKHIIFIGADINSFPPIPTDNFLFSYKNEVEYFYHNDYYLSSKVQYEILKSISDNIYLVIASHDGKKELTPSILVDKRADALTIDVSSIKSKSDLVMEGKVVLNENEKGFIESITSNHFTSFDGVGVKGFNADRLSASQINSYTGCPLKYLYSYKMRVEAPKTTEDGFDVMEKGSLMHLCFELFGKAVKSMERDTVDKEILTKLMYEKSNEAFITGDFQKVEKNICHYNYLFEIQAGLVDDRGPGVLLKFVNHYIEKAVELNYFKNSEFEKKFYFDKDLKPYSPKDRDDERIFISGIIDRYDVLNDRVSIIDYKSKKVTSKYDTKKIEEIKELKDIQLALYLLFSEQDQNELTNQDSSLLTFNGKNDPTYFANMSTYRGADDSVIFNGEYRDRLRNHIYSVKESIENGYFPFDNSDEKSCGWCDYKNICHQSLLNKGKEVEIG